MIILNSTLKLLEVILSGAVTTTQMPIVASYVDVTTTTYTPGAADTQTNGGTAVTVAAAPGAGVQRQVKLLTVYNADTVPGVATVRLNDNATMRILVKITLPVGATLVYTDGEGFRVIDSTGAVLGVGPSGATGATGLMGAQGFPVDGLDGLDGDPGPPGAVGVAGATGAGGATGPAGPYTIGPPGQDGDEPEIPWMIRGATGAAGAGTPAGSDTQVQFNDSSAFGGDGGLTYNKTTDILTLGSGLAFPATQAAVTDANTLDDYEEGTWTPNDASGASLALTNLAGQSMKIGRLVLAWGNVTYPVTASGLASSIGGLPYTSGTAAQGEFGGYVSFSNYTASLRVFLGGSSTAIAFYSGVGSATITNVQLSATTVSFCVIYRASA